MQSTDFVEHSGSDEAAWAKAHFGTTCLGHRQRTERAVTIAEAMAARPGRSIPHLFDDVYDVKAAYTFFGHPRCTLDALQSSHRGLVAREAGECALVLAIEDTTDVSFSGGRRRDGLGSIGAGEPWQQGFWLHSVLLVDCPEGRVLDEGGAPLPVRVLGLGDQQQGVRPWPKKPKRKRAKQKAYRSTARLGHERETQMWERSIERMGPPDASTRRVRVADRGADYYEYLAACQASGDGYIVRACYNRVLIDGQQPGYLMDRARSLEARGEVVIELRERKGKPAREARLSVSFARVRIRAPQRPGGGPGKREPIECSVVRVWEPEPPSGAEALEWVVLTDEQVESFEQAREVVARYAKRWLVEEFHKALKTGLGAERLQLETAERLVAAIAVMSVVALRLLEVRERTRMRADAPAEESGLDELELRLLRARLATREIRTVRDVALAIGRLGGHMNRAGDGMPGWITLWRGMQELQLLVAGARLARTLDDLG